MTYFNVSPLENLIGSKRFNDNKNLTFVIPVGVGIKYPISNMAHLGLEVGGRWTATDYLDGLTTQFSTAYDIYYFTLLNVVFKIETYSRRRIRRP